MPGMASPSASSETSFYTAQEGSPFDGPRERRGPKDRRASGGANAKERHDASGDGSAGYRPVRELPYQLRDHIRVFLEEKMYGEAIHLLTSLLAAGGSDRLGQPSALSPVWLPPASHLSLLASLAVHPAYTTRPQDGTDMRVAGHAMQYLRHVLALAGPVRSDMAAAFAYRDARGQRAFSARAGTSRARSFAGSARGSARGSTANSRSSSARPRRQLRAVTGRSSLHAGEYVDSTSMTFSDDEGSARRGPSKRRSAGENDGVGVGGGGSGDDPDDLDQDDNAEDGDEDAVSGRMATRDGVWMRGQGFWRVAAWALSCSVREPARWRCWRPWLAFMVDVMEADLAERLAASDDEGRGAREGRQGGDAEDLYDSLLFQYLSDESAAGAGAGGSSGSSGIGGHSTTRLRHLASAVLADGSQPALAREVFDKETMITAETSASAVSARPKRALDLEHGQFGDYSDDDESAPSTPEPACGSSGSGSESSPSPSPSPSLLSKKKTRPAKRSASRRPPNSTDVSSNPGFLESLPLRRRLFHLMALGSVYFPAAFATTDAVYRAFAEVLKETDISVFAAFVTAPLPPFSAGRAALAPDHVFAGLLRHILFTFLPAAAPKPHIVDADALVSSLPSSRVLERCFLPFAANTVLLGANVRMALAIESLFRLAWQPPVPSSAAADDDEPLWSAALQAAAETGVRAREARARGASSSAAAAKSTTKPAKQQPSVAVEAYGRDMLQRSGRRLLAMVQLARMDAGEPEMVMGDL